MIKRSHTCGELSENWIGKNVSLNGWISKTRNLGSLIFIDLRDRYGKTQIVFNEESDKQNFEIAKSLGLEDVIGIRGMVVKRPNEAINKDMLTGRIDVEVEDLVVYNESKPPPFDINNRDSSMEENRLKFRYLELRTVELQRNMLVRHQASLHVRNFFSEKDFLEIETPILMKSTPEGARDFVVPSRIHKGRFYALPQSPQTYKQLLMVSGMDKYFQIVKCFRDEDFRADRQPEFTQIDIEMSFVDQEEIIALGTSLIKSLWSKILDVDLPEKFLSLTYKECIDMYGSDKPDLRFDMKLFDFSDYVNRSDFKTFKEILKNKGLVKAVVCPNSPNYSRKVIDELTDYLKKYHKARGLAWMKYEGGKLDGGISKFFPHDVQKQIVADQSVDENSIVFIVGDIPSVVNKALGALRLELGSRENLINKSDWCPLWVTDFPLVEWDEDSERWHALHHPFTSPHPSDSEILNQDPGRVRSLAYDIVMNGYELGGGSIRIHDSKQQADIFKLLGISDDEAKEKFGFLMNAFSYGAPPHGGMAFGFDRIVMLLLGSTQIRDVIAFPKTTSATSLMDNSPSQINDEQLKELSLQIK